MIQSFLWMQYFVAQVLACPDRIVKRHWDRDGRVFRRFLHPTVAAALAGRKETVLFQNLADLPARK